MPQGSVLGVHQQPLQTSAYPMKATQFYYADDLVLYKVIGSDSCSAHGSMQEDIDRIAEWTNVNLLNFNRL